MILPAEGDVAGVALAQPDKDSSSAALADAIVPTKLKVVRYFPKSMSPRLVRTPQSGQTAHLERH